MEEPVFRETRIRNEAEIKRKVQPLPKRDEDSSLKVLCGLTDLQKSIHYLTQRTLKYRQGYDLQ
jgi:hypothetical protein